MANPVSKVYGEMAYAQTEDSQDNQTKNTVTLSRAAKRRMYGFNLPSNVANEIGQEDLTIVLVAQGFCDNTTSHGIPHTFKASSGGKKIIWLILSLLSLAALTYHLSQLIVTFVKYETSTDIVVNNSIRSLEFPAVTICNNNMLRTSAIDVTLRNIISAASQRSDKSKATEEIVDTLAYEYALYDDPEQKLLLGHLFDKLVISAKFNYMDVLGEFVHIFNPFHGNCFTFNHYSDNNKSTSARAGANNGLLLMLNIEQYEYVPFLTEASGVKVLIHNPNEMPFPEDGGLTVAPNTLTRLAVRKTQFKRLNGRYGDCLLKGVDDMPETIYQFEHGYSYSKSACQKSCVQQQTIQECGCYIPQIPYNETFYSDSVEVAACDYAGSSADCMDSVFYSFTTAQLQCNECKDPCHEDVYDVTPSSTVWPAPTYMVDLKEDMLVDRPLLFKDLKDHYELHDSITVPIQENLLQVMIFYDRMSVTQNEQTAKVSDFEFVSDLGGSLGLWVGWSMLTVFEFFEFGIDLLVLCLVKLKISQDNKKTHPQRIHVQERSSLQATKYS